jgi:hypothetical protein
VERRERRQYQHAINTATIKAGIPIPIPMPILPPVLSPGLGAEVEVWEEIAVGEVDVKEVEAVEEEVDKVMLKEWLLMCGVSPLSGVVALYSWNQKTG